MLIGRKRGRNRTVLVLLTGLALSGCAMKQNKSFQCEETTKPLAGIDAALPQGGTVRELLGTAFGRHAFVIQRPANRAAVATYEPNSEGVKATLEVSYTGGKVEYIESRAAELPKNSPVCADSLRVEVTGRLQSDDGAFAETVPMVLMQRLRSEGPNGEQRLVLEAELPLRGRQGSFKLGQPSGLPAESAQELFFVMSWLGQSPERGKLHSTWRGKPIVEPDGTQNTIMATMHVYDFVVSGGGAK